MVGILIALVAMVLIPVRASRGAGYRGAHIGTAIALFIAAFFVGAIFVGATAPADVDADTARGIALMSDIGPDVTFALAGMGLGCLMGAAFWRPKNIT